MATAIMFATITNIVAYVPFAFLSGDTGRFLYSMPVVIGCSLVASRLVSMTFIESETVKPKEQGSAITTSGAVKVLSGKANSVNGVTAQYEYQVLFYVPQIGSQDRVRLLGYSYSLIRAFALSG